MIRFTKAIAVAAVALMLPTVASALGVTIVNQSESVADDGIIEVGESITFDLVLGNTNDVAVFGLDVLAFGFDTEPGGLPHVSSGLTLAGGASTGGAFGNPAVGRLDELTNVIPVPVLVHNRNELNPEVVRARLFGAITASLANGSTSRGRTDIGIAGNEIRDGDVHMQVTFINVNSDQGTFPSTWVNLEFGTNAALGGAAIGDGGVILPFNNDIAYLTVIPEPGTALLMGLGLAGLAANRRR
jgi:hypothetical protein